MSRKPKYPPPPPPLARAGFHRELESDDLDLLRELTRDVCNAIDDLYQALQTHRPDTYDEQDIEWFWDWLLNNPDLSLKAANTLGEALTAYWNENHREAKLVATQ
jgi:hypothetical protein